MPLFLSIDLDENTMAVDDRTEEYAAAMEEAIASATRAESERDVLAARVAELEHKNQIVKGVLKTLHDSINKYCSDHNWKYSPTICDVCGIAFNISYEGGSTCELPNWRDSCGHCFCEECSEKFVEFDEDEEISGCHACRLPDEPKPYHTIDELVA